MRYRVGGLKWSQRHRIKQSGMIAARPAFADDDIGDFFANETQSKVLTRWHMDDNDYRHVFHGKRGYSLHVRRIDPRSGKRFKKRALLFGAFRSGASIRRAAQVAGVARMTAIKWFRSWQTAKYPCGCGKPQTHNGWCRHRFLLSPARQRAMRELHVLMSRRSCIRKACLGIKEMP